MATRLAGPTTMVVERSLYAEKQYAVGDAGERMRLSSRGRNGGWMKRWMARLAIDATWGCDADAPDIDELERWSLVTRVTISYRLIPKRGSRCGDSKRLYVGTVGAVVAGCVLNRYGTG